jgi:hypothetical protein
LRRQRHSDNVLSERRRHTIRFDVTYGGIGFGLGGRGTLKVDGTVEGTLAQILAFNWPPRD